MEKARKLEFFRELPGDLVQTLLNAGTLTTLKRKTCVFQSRENTGAVYISLSGKVMICNLTKHGGRKIIFILGGGHLLNQNVAGKKPAPIFCETMSSVLLLKIPAKTFRELMERHYALAAAVLREYERYLLRMSHQLKNTTGSTRLERKIAAKLWKLGRDFGVREEDGIRLDLDLTVTLMADMVGAPRETVSRACKALSDRGLILYKNRQFLLTDPDGLAQFYKM